MTKDEIRAEFEAFMEFNDSSERRYVTTTSALLFAQHIAEKVARTAQIAPEGWRLVPVEPTPEMMKAMVPHHKRLGVAWREALAVAPECTRIAHTPDEHTNQSASSSG